MDEEDSSPRSLTRMLGAFEAMAHAADGLTLAELSQALSSPKSSLLMLLRPLVAMGYLVHGDGRYRIGPRLFRLTAEIMAARRFPNLIRPYMEELVARCGESVYLAVLDRAARVVSYVERIDSPQSIRYIVPVGSIRPLYCSAAGRLLLAFEDESWREHYLRTVPLDKVTPRTVTDPDRLRAELAKIRSDGVAISLGEAVPGAAGIAAPIFAIDGTLDAALLIGAPIDRFERQLAALRTAVVEVAARASGRASGRARAAVSEPRQRASRKRA